MKNKCSINTIQHQNQRNDKHVQKQSCKSKMHQSQTNSFGSNLSTQYSQPSLKNSNNINALKQQYNEKQNCLQTAQQNQITTIDQRIGRFPVTTTGIRDLSEERAKHKIRQQSQSASQKGSPLKYIANGNNSETNNHMILNSYQKKEQEMDTINSLELSWNQFKNTHNNFEKKASMTTSLLYTNNNDQLLDTSLDQQSQTSLIINQKPLKAHHQPQLSQATCHIESIVPKSKISLPGYFQQKIDSDINSNTINERQQQQNTQPCYQNYYLFPFSPQRGSSQDQQNKHETFLKSQSIILGTNSNSNQIEKQQQQHFQHILDKYSNVNNKQKVQQQRQVPIGECSNGIPTLQGIKYDQICIQVDNPKKMIGNLQNKLSDKNSTKVGSARSNINVKNTKNYKDNKININKDNNGKNNKGIKNNSNSKRNKSSEKNRQIGLMACNKHKNDKVVKNQKILKNEQDVNRKQHVDKQSLLQSNGSISQFQIKNQINESQFSASQNINNNVLYQSGNEEYREIQQQNNIIMPSNNLIQNNDKQQQQQIQQQQIPTQQHQFNEEALKNISIQIQLENQKQKFQNNKTKNSNNDENKITDKYKVKQAALRHRRHQSTNSGMPNNNFACNNTTNPTNILATSNNQNRGIQGSAKHNSDKKSIINSHQKSQSTSQWNVATTAMSTIPIEDRQYLTDENPKLQSLQQQSMKVYQIDLTLSQTKSKLQMQNQAINNTRIFLKNSSSSIKQSIAGCDEVANEPRPNILNSKTNHIKSYLDGHQTKYKQNNLMAKSQGHQLNNASSSGFHKPVQQKSFLLQYFQK